MKAWTRAALIGATLAALVLAMTTTAFAARPAGGDMPGNGYGHCRNFPNNGHQGHESNGRGHLRDGGECAGAPWNDDDAPETGGPGQGGGQDTGGGANTGTTDDGGTSQGGQDSDPGDTGDSDGVDDTTRDDGRIDATGGGRTPVDRDGDGDVDSEDGTFEVGDVTAGGRDGEGAFALPEGDTSIPLAGELGSPTAAGGGVTATPSRIDAGFGLTGIAAQSSTALLGMALALWLAFGSLLRRSSWS